MAPATSDLAVGTAVGPATFVDVSSSTLRLALTYVLEMVGHRMWRDRGSADVVLVDLVGLADRPATTLLVDPVPASCQVAVDAVVRGAVRSAVCSDEPERVPDVLASAVGGMIALPSRVVELANRAPRLSRRLRATLHLVLAGYTNKHLAMQLHQSESTVKRDINALLESFAAHNRLALVAAARAAGFDRPLCLEPPPLEPCRTDRRCRLGSERA